MEYYEELYDIISFDGFNFARYYEGEKNILKPRMEELGFTNILFGDGERDGFGVLSRVAEAVDADGRKRFFVYG